MLLTAIIVLIVDQYTKHLAIVHLAPSPERGGWPRWINIIPGFFDLRWAENTGGAFSFMHTQPWVILGIASLMIVGILIWAYRMPQKNFIIQLSFGLIIGGAIGNIIDRTRFGYVIDFLHFYIVRNGREHFWPTFNVADMGIVAGIAIFMVLTLFTKLLDPVAVEPPALESDDLSPAAQEQS